MPLTTLESAIQDKKGAPSIVLGFAAPIEAGKTTVSTAVAKRLNATRVSFGGYLRELADREHRPITREELQALGERLVRQNVQSFCTEVLKQQHWQQGAPLIIDGVRHEEVLAELREQLAPAPEYLIYINVDRTTQTKRLERDDLPHQKPLEELERDPTEVQVRSILPDHASLILNGTRPVDVLVEQVIQFVHQSLLQGKAVGAAEKNGRRIELAKRKAREDLTLAESAEFDQLQQWYSDYLDAKHPLPASQSALLDQLEARLRAGK